MKGTVTISAALLRHLICNTECLIADRERDLQRERDADHAAWLRRDIAFMRSTIADTVTMINRSTHT